MKGPLGRSGLCAVVVATVGTAFACTDQGARSITGPNTRDVETMAMVYNTIWNPVHGGSPTLVNSVSLEYHGTAAAIASGRLSPSFVKGITDPVMASQGRFAFAAASRLIPVGGISIGPAFDLGTNSVGSSSASVVDNHAGKRSVVRRTRVLKSKTIDGKLISVALLPDSGTDGRPAVASVILVNHRVTAIAEHQYAGSSGKWREVRTRVTHFDSLGHADFIALRDANQVTSIAKMDATGALGGVRALGSILVAGMSRLVQPDALYAATPRGDAGCWIEAANSLAAAASVVATGAVVVAAEAAVAAADVAMAAAIATCPADPVGCLIAIAAAAAAQTAAAVGLTAANAALAAAITASAAADAALWACLHATSDSYTGTYDDGGSGGGDSCDVTIWYDDSGDISEIDGDLEDCRMD